MKRKWGEVINSSDEVHICIDDAPAAALAVLYVGCGKYGLDDADGKTLMPLWLFGAKDGVMEADFEKTHGCAMASVSGERIVAAAHTAQYGSASEIEAIEAALDGLPDRDERVKKYEDRKRTSMSRIVDAFHAVKVKTPDTETADAAKKGA